MALAWLLAVAPVLLPPPVQARAAASRATTDATAAGHGGTNKAAETSPAQGPASQPETPRAELPTATPTHHPGATADGATGRPRWPAELGATPTPAESASAGATAVGRTQLPGWGSRTPAPGAPATIPGGSRSSPVLLAQAQRPSSREQRLPPPSPHLLRSLDALQREIETLDRNLQPPAEAQPMASGPELLDALKAPPPQALPDTAAAVTIRRQVRISLPTALAVAVRNDPDLTAEVRTVRERRDLANAARGRWWPELALQLAGSLSGQQSYNSVWDDNAGLYPIGSPFLVLPNGWNLIQTNTSFAGAGLTLNWELISPGRGAAIAEADQELRAAGQRYGDRLRQLQLSTSEAYYGLQLADQLQRIRSTVVERDTVVRDQVAALKEVGLVPRLDLLRAEADLQQSRYRLAQAEALQRSRQRQLSNRLNVPFDITLVASAAVVLQPPWPLDLEQTLVRGFQANPQLQALQAAREALLRQADRRAAQLLPTVRLVAGAGYGETLTSKPGIQLEGCCAATNIRQLYNQSADWAAALQLHWRVFDGGVTASEAAASRSAAGRTAETLARERNAIRQRLEAAFFDHRASLEQIVAARASYAAAREAFRDVRARYQLGLADYSDVADTISTLTTAMEGVAESTTLANVSYAQLLRELLPVPEQPGTPVSLPLVLELGDSPKPAGPSSAMPTR